MSITKIHAREILDSRGNPTVEVDLWTAKGEQLLPVPERGPLPVGRSSVTWSSNCSQVCSGLPFPAAPRPASTRPWSSVMETRAATWAKVGGAKCQGAGTDAAFIMAAEQRQISATDTQ